VGGVSEVKEMRIVTSPEIKGDTETGLRSAICIYLIAEHRECATVDESRSPPAWRPVRDRRSRPCFEDPVSELVEQGEVRLEEETEVSLEEETAVPV
jgi:hypothetical protein